MSWNIRDVKSWAPGILMGFDNREQLRKHPVEARELKMVEHTGVGIVVHNDGEKTIHVVWGGNCRDQFCEYDVTTLNSQVIRRLG